MRLSWYEHAWADYCSWQKEDKKTLRRINELIKSTMRTPYDGIGKPEPLKDNLQGWWSRRIDSRNRIVYRLLDDDTLIIAACKGHYN